MRKIFFIAIVLFMGKTVTAQVGVNTDSPKVSFQVMADKYAPAGIMAPQVTAKELNDATGLTAYDTKQTGAIVYVTDIAEAKGATVNIKKIGYYYFDGSLWQPFSAGANTGNAWNLGGNAGVTSNILGTTDNEDLSIATNNTQRILVTKDGSVGINSANAQPNTSAILDVNSQTQGALLPRMTTVQREAISAPADGLTVYDTTIHCFEYYNASTSSWVSMCGGTPNPNPTPMPIPENCNDKNISKYQFARNVADYPQSTAIAMGGEVVHVSKTYTGKPGDWQVCSPNKNGIYLVDKCNINVRLGGACATSFTLYFDRPVNDVAVLTAMYAYCNRSSSDSHRITTNSTGSMSITNISTSGLNRYHAEINNLGTGNWGSLTQGMTFPSGTSLNIGCNSSVEGCNCNTMRYVVHATKPYTSITVRQGDTNKDDIIMAFGFCDVVAF